MIKCDLCGEAIARRDLLCRDVPLGPLRQLGIDELCEPCWSEVNRRMSDTRASITKIASVAWDELAKDIAREKGRPT
jgi:hypothetical protein